MANIVPEPGNDDETSALIARMLAEDNPYAADAYGGGDSEHDSDYAKPKRRKKAKTGARKQPAAKYAAAAAAQPASIPAAAPAEAPQDAAGQQAANSDQPAAQPAAADAAAAAAVPELTETGRKRRRDTGTARTEARPWTPGEERLFREALELHGRDWGACAAHIGSRDAKSVTSHAQKYMIKMCMDGALLPPKMAESGAGYTLSGKLLDPDSASARAYGLKPAITAKLRAEGAACLVGLTPPAVDEHGNAIPPPPQPEKPPKAAAKPKARPKPAKKQQQEQQEAKPDAWQAAQRTEYALARPRREAAAGARSALGGTSESLELVRCHDFVGPPGSGASQAQPFSLEVQTQATVMCDFHAHLSTAEIIGLLGGHWHPDTRRLVVTAAFPCRSACGSQSGVSVELDPEDEVQTRALMQEKGLVTVGWYHSHPVFETRPSLKDCENQRNYQALFRDEASAHEPFIAAIFGPYDPQLPDQRSATSWFVVQSRNADGGKELAPFNLRFSIGARAVLSEEETARLLALARTTAGDLGRVDLSERWRPFTRVVEGRPEGPALTRLDKLRGALRAHLPAEPPEATEAWLDKLLADLRAL